MDPIRNPFAPGAGRRPPELAGRDPLRERMRLCLGRLRIGRSARSIMLLGLRGVGKTVLLDRMMLDAEADGVVTIRLEAAEGRSLPALLAPHLRLALLRWSKLAHAADYAVRGLKALAGFVHGLKVTYHDIEVGLDFEPEPGLADNGELESDLGALLEQVGLAARAAHTVMAIFIDELQYVHEAELAALISACHRAAQKELPVTLVGAGLPQLRGQMGEAKTYAERLFEFAEIGALDAVAARAAIVIPIENEEERIDEEAVAMIIAQTEGYPYFLQEWGKHAWDYAAASPITVSDVSRAADQAVAALDENLFRVRFDRLTPKEKDYLRAMAGLGAGPHRSGAIARALGRPTAALGPIRGTLISKGMIWSPAHGETAFTVPLFDAFMKRIMPGEAWRSTGA